MLAEKFQEGILLFMKILENERQIYKFDERRNELRGIIYGKNYIEKIELKKLRKDFDIVEELFGKIKGYGLQFFNRRKYEEFLRLFEEVNYRLMLLKLSTDKYFDIFYFAGIFNVCEYMKININIINEELIRQAVRRFMRNIENETEQILKLHYPQAYYKRRKEKRFLSFQDIVDEDRGLIENTLNIDFGYIPYSKSMYNIELDIGEILKNPKRYESVETIESDFNKF
jgi:hypothetical protein